MRPVTRVDTPPAHPYVCISCGLGVGPLRRFFIDLGFDIAEPHYRAVYDGAVYLCDVCAPSWVDAILRILADDRDAIFDNQLQKEEATYGFMERIAGGSELSAVRDGEPELEISGARTDRGTFSSLDQGENLPDAGERSSAPPSSELTDSTVGTVVTTGRKPTESAPRFRMGQLVPPDPNG